MTAPLPTYRFAAWTRRGLADKIKTADAGAALPARANVAVGLTVTSASAATYNLSLYGPGDVIGLDTTSIVRTDPRPNATDVEANLFPLIEFDAPDLPWLFTPAMSGANNRLRPWCVLVVVDLSVVDAPTALPGHPLPVLSVPGAVRATELPDLSESWAWAHVQGLLPSTTSNTELGPLLQRDPSLGVSRIVAPRRLEPGKRYAACLVPAFDAGVARGLSGAVPMSATIAAAWTTDTSGDVQLPVYYHWEFSTGPAGDFEALARRIKPATPPETAGVEPLFIGEAGSGLPTMDPADPAAYLDMDGPLRAPARSNASLADVPVAIQAALEKTLNAPAARATTADGDPAHVLGPPIYGEWPANQHTVPTSTPAWLRELNLDPRARAAAGLGAEIERQNQETFMQWAWEQVGDVLEANAALSRAQLSMETLDRVHARHIATLPEDRALQLCAPMHPRAPQGDVTVRASIERSSLPNAAGDPALRRLTSPQNRFMKAALRRMPAAATTSQAAAVATPTRSTLVAQLASGTVTIDPTRFVLDGVAGEPDSLAWSSVLWEQTFDGAGLPRLGFDPDAKAIHDAAVLMSTTPLPPPLTSAQMASTIATGGWYGNPLGAAPSASAALAPNAVSLAPQFVPFALAGAKASLLARTNPRATVAARMQSRLVTGDSAAPRGCNQIMAAPSLDVPVYRYLAQLDPARFLPGVGDLPPDSAMLLETNPRFVEALLVGLNAEMNRELLWREFPTDQRGTPFKHFWNWSDGVADIEPVNTWKPTNPLGANSRSSSGGQVVLLIRGRLLQRFPNTAIYAWRATGSRLVNPPQPTDLRYPVFSGTLGADVAFVGFDLTDADLAQGDGWFFVLQEQPTEPRFGFDEGTGAPSATMKSWLDASWDDAGTAPGHYLHIGGNRLAGTKLGNAQFVTDSSHLAYITVQQPVLVALHARSIISNSNV